MEAKKKQSREHLERTARSIKTPQRRKQVRCDKGDGGDEKKVDLIRQTTGYTQKSKENQSHRLQVTRKSREGGERGDLSMYPKHGSASS